jgi:uridine kinase
VVYFFSIIPGVLYFWGFTKNQILEKYTKPLIIGFTGGSGSGKTSFVRELTAYFKDSVSVLSQDNYYKPRELQEIDPRGFRNFDLPFSIDSEKMAADLRHLAAGHVLVLEEYNFNNAKVGKKTIEILPARIVLVEGLFVLGEPEIAKQLNVKVYVHAKDNLKIIRRIRRDQLERNYPIDDVLYRYENHVYPTFEKYIKPFRDNADIVINNNHNFEVGLEVLKGYLSNYLSESRLEG